MPPDQLAQTESALTDAAMNSSRAIAGVLAGIALFSTANTALIALLTTSRILFGISRDDSLPRMLSKTFPRRQTPWVAALVALGLSMALLPLKKVEILASVASFTTMIAFIAVNAALIRLRLSQPEKERPFRVPVSFRSIPVFPVLGMLSCIIFIFQFDRKIYAVGFAAFVCSAGIYFLYAGFRRRSIE